LSLPPPQLSQFPVPVVAVGRPAWAILQYISQFKTLCLSASMTAQRALLPLAGQQRWPSATAVLCRPVSEMSMGRAGISTDALGTTRIHA